LFQIDLVQPNIVGMLPDVFLEQAKERELAMK
jgi:hypothetical protein